MNRLLGNIITAIVVMVAMSAMPSASALSVLPLLFVRANSWGRIADVRHAVTVASSRSSTAVKMPSPQLKVDSESPILSAAMLRSDEFGRDDDLMRYKHELLLDIYEKAMSRGRSDGFGRDDDLMRYKLELLLDIYEKAMSRGFEN